jgi:hypothetical protein
MCLRPPSTTVDEDDERRLDLLARTIVLGRNVEIELAKLVAEERRPVWNVQILCDGSHDEDRSELS